MSQYVIPPEGHPGTTGDNRPVVGRLEQLSAAPPRHLGSVLAATVPGSVEYRLAWFLDELGQRFPEAYKPWIGAAPEGRFLETIDAVLEELQHLRDTVVILREEKES